LGVACASTKGASGSVPLSPLESSLADFAALEDGATLYCVIDVPAARPLAGMMPLATLLGGADMEEALDRTESVALALYSGRERSYLAAARGRFPAFRMGLSLSFNAAWKKRKSTVGSAYWRNESQRLSLAIDGKRVIVSNTDPNVPPPGAALPKNFGEFLHSGGAVASSGQPVMAGWLPRAEATLSRFIEELGLPLQIPAEQLLFVLYPLQEDAGMYTAALRVDTPSASQARALVTLFTMARLMLGNADSAEGTLAAALPILFAATPEQDGASLVIRCGALSDKALALLFSLFSIDSARVYP
jgi:hypothetical protein